MREASLGSASDRLVPGAGAVIGLVAYEVGHTTGATTLPPPAAGSPTLAGVGAWLQLAAPFTIASGATARMVDASIPSAGSPGTNIQPTVLYAAIATLVQAGIVTHFQQYTQASVPSDWPTSDTAGVAFARYEFVLNTVAAPTAPPGPGMNGIDASTGNWTPPTAPQAAWQLVPATSTG